MPVAEYVDAQEARGAHTMVCSLSGNSNGAAECAMCGDESTPGILKHRKVVEHG